MLTLKQHYAGLAMQAMIASGGVSRHPKAAIAQQAFEYAEAMMQCDVDNKRLETLDTLTQMSQELGMGYDKEGVWASHITNQ